MRKLIVSNAVSLDGYHTGPDDNVMVLELDPVFDAYNAERLRAPTRSCSDGTRSTGSRTFGRRSLTIPTRSGATPNGRCRDATTKSRR
jgi:hypothetical protein